MQLAAALRKIIEVNKRIWRKIELLDDAAMKARSDYINSRQILWILHQEYPCANQYGTMIDMKALKMPPPPLRGRES